MNMRTLTAYLLALVVTSPLAAQQFTADFEQYTPATYYPLEARTITEGLLTISGGNVAYGHPCVGSADPTVRYESTTSGTGSGLCSNCPPAVTLDFSEAVTHVRFHLITHCANGDYFVEDDLGHQLTIPSTAMPVGTLLPVDLPYHGIRQVRITHVIPDVPHGWFINVDDISYYRSTIAFDLAAAQNARVLSNRYDVADPYPAGQIADHQFPLTATVSTSPQLVAGTAAYFRIIDPPDTAPYGPSQPRPPNDNADAAAGTFDGASAKTFQGTTDAQGRVSLTVHTTAVAAGDNYRVEASLDPAILNPASPCGAGCVSSGTITAWKRVYVETDRMFRKGAFIMQPAAVGATELYVSSVTDFAAAKGNTPGSQLRLVHAPHRISGAGVQAFYYEPMPNEAPITVVAIDATAKKLTLSRPLLREFLPTDGASYLADGVGVITGNDATDYYSASTALFVPRFQDAFVEYLPAPLPAGSCGCTPHRPNFTTSGPAANELFEFAARWLDRSSSTGAPLPNTFHLLGGSQRDNGAAFGDRPIGYRTAWVWVKTIEAQKLTAGKRNALIGEVSTHELTHAWLVNQAFNSDGHCDQKAYDSSFLKCTMWQTWVDVSGAVLPEFHDSKVEYHYVPTAPSISEYLTIRRHVEPIQ